MNLELPLMPSGLFQGDYWPPACDLLSDEVVTAVLPQASVVERRSSDQTLRILGLGGSPSFTARDAHCEIDLDIPEAGLTTGDPGSRDAPWITVTVDAAGTPEMADRNSLMNDDAGLEPVRTTTGICYPAVSGGLGCLKGGVTFRVVANLPFQEMTDDSWGTRYRVDGRTTAFSVPVDGEIDVTELDRHQKFVTEVIEARLVEPILAGL